MSDDTARFETLEHRLMRAWMRREAGELRKLLARDCMLIIAASPPQLLDRPSFVEAAGGRFSCTGFRFHEVSVRRHGGVAWVAAAADLELRLAGQDWQGRFWISDLWKKGSVSRNWKLVERSLSRIDEDARLSGAIRQLQLWN